MIGGGGGKGILSKVVKGISSRTCHLRIVMNEGHFEICHIKF